MTTAGIKTVLIVEDDASLRKTISAFLGDSGYRIVEAGDGQEGLEVFSREKPDIVLTDLRMPVMDGMTLVSRIKTQNPRMPIVVLSGTEDDDTLAIAIRRGAAEYVLKPIDDLEKLDALVARLILSAEEGIGNG